ncbi:MAG: carboxymuconolactone decarboxylase family protein [Gammaproteobacteria bacterium]|jgi:AhpD family alkylhydroperoxidase|nr:carboxymuconolactone decarboxylase family protein [Gammaproteobacteria bacterium]
MIDHPEIVDYAKKAFGKFGDVLPDTMSAFGKLQQTTFRDGALDIKTKELIALGISVAQGCDGCMAWHSAALNDLGVSREEAAEALGVAVEMGGGVALYSAAKAMDGYDQFLSARSGGKDTVG